MMTNYHKAIEQLQAMFPKVEQKTITSAFVANNGHLEKTIQALQTLSQESNQKQALEENEEANVPEEYSLFEETPESKIEHKSESMIQNLSQFTLGDQDKSISLLFKDVNNTTHKANENIPLIAQSEPRNKEADASLVQQSEQKIVKEKKAERPKLIPPKKAFSFVSSGIGTDFITDAVDPIPKVRRTISVCQNCYVEPSKEEEDVVITRKRKDSFARKVGKSISNLFKKQNKKKVL